jgi:uncharacterized LabA/DUF88 family protein
MVPDTPSVVVLIDYQNIHLTARDVFAPPGTDARDALVDPVAFAERLVEVRAKRQQIPEQKNAKLHAVKIYRGTPSNQREPRLYSANQRQAANWSRDSRVEITSRTLRYPANWGESWCEERPREKGIDVLVALDVVDLAQQGTYDVVILASHDTDMEPAIERALYRGRSRVETGGWHGARRLKPGRRNVWHTALDGADFVEVRDRRNYW